MIRILALSGSLSRVSPHTFLLRAAQQLAPPGIEVSLYERLGELPHPSLDRIGKKVSEIISFREELLRADAVVISTPEYAHGVPGFLKNALDWVVKSGEFSGKPVGLLKAEEASFAYGSLAAALNRMNAHVSEEAVVSIPIAESRLNLADIIGSPTFSASILQVILILACEAQARLEIQGGVSSGSIVSIR